MSDEERAKPSQDKTVRFHMLKGTAYRTIYADGAFGGVTPQGQMVQMVLFNTRSPVPKSIVHEVSDGKLGGEIREERDEREGVVRELEANIIMRPDTALSVAKWLIEKAMAAGAELESAGFMLADEDTAEEEH